MKRRCEEGAPIVDDGGPPAWLTGQFPEHSEWKSWRLCCLRVDPGHSTGLDLEPMDSGGFQVAAVRGSPQQPKDLLAGRVILGIAGYPLFGLEGDALENAFKDRLLDGVEVQVLDARELREAEVQRDGEDANESTTPKEELSSDGSLLVLPVGECAVRSMPEGARTDLEGDLKILGSNFHVVADLRCPPTLGVDSISLRGEPEQVQAARRDLQAILEFYGFSIPPPRV
mmetsp:Transcript_10992/g.20496  ORF Transcript_10992/g.20496 Transcript_10992/m.20496 type:complete len:228 (-) Transcript_10992:65-748(-)